MLVSKPPLPPMSVPTALTLNAPVERALTAPSVGAPPMPPRPVPCESPPLPPVAVALAVTLLITQFGTLMPSPWVALSSITRFSTTSPPAVPPKKIVPICGSGVA